MFDWFNIWSEALLEWIVLCLPIQVRYISTSVCRDIEKSPSRKKNFKDLSACVCWIDLIFGLSLTWMRYNVSPFLRSVIYSLLRHWWIRHSVQFCQRFLGLLILIDFIFSMKQYQVRLLKQLNTSFFGQCKKWVCLISCFLSLEFNIILF